MRAEDANATLGNATAISTKARSLADSLELMFRDLLGFYFRRSARLAPAPRRDVFPNLKREKPPPTSLRALICDSVGHTAKPCPLVRTRRRFARRTHPYRSGFWPGI